MELPEHLIVRLAAALGVGVLIGIERERSKGEGPEREVAGVRTFTLVSLTGAMSLLVGDMLAFVAFAAVLGVLVAVGYTHTRAHDPGMTTEVALLIAYLLGGVAMREPALAAALAVIVAILLVARTRLHNWVRNVLTDSEMHDALLLLAAALVILPLMPDRAIDPWGVIHLRKLWMLAVLMMSINGLGYIALRAIGPKVGLALAGLFSGFVSSTATIAAMGARARAHPKLRRSAVAGAAVSSLATVIQLVMVIGLVSLPTLQHLVLPLLASGLTALVYSALFTIRSVRESDAREPPAGRPFSPRTALIFVAVVGTTLVLSTLFTQWLGDRGLLIASSVAGFADTHSAAISAASLAAGERATIHVAAIAVLIAFTTNAISKTVVAFALGDKPFAFELLPGLVLMVAAAWGGYFATTLLGWQI